MATPTHRAEEEVDTRSGALRKPGDRSNQPGQGANPVPADEEKRRELERASRDGPGSVVPPLGSEGV